MSENQFRSKDRTYSFGTIPPEEAIDVQVAVAKVIGEPLFKAFTEGFDAASEGEATKDKLEKMGAAGAMAIGLMMSRMDAKEVSRTMKIVFRYVGIGGDKTKLEMNDFHGRNKEMWLVFIHALRFNFADFLPESLFSSLRDALPKE